MKFTSFIILAVAGIVIASASIGGGNPHGQDVLTQAQYHIELSPGETRWVTEEEKWELKRV